MLKFCGCHMIDFRREPFATPALWSTTQFSQPVESTDSAGFLFLAQVAMGQRVAHALSCRFATPRDDVLAAFFAAKPEFSAVVSAPEGRSPRIYAILCLTIFSRINASLSMTRMPVVCLYLAVLRRTPRTRNLSFAEICLHFLHELTTSV